MLRSTKLGVESLEIRSVLAADGMAMATADAPVEAEDQLLAAAQAEYAACDGDQGGDVGGGAGDGSVDDTSVDNTDTSGEGEDTSLPAPNDDESSMTGDASSGFNLSINVGAGNDNGGDGDSAGGLNISINVSAGANAGGDDSGDDNTGDDPGNGDDAGNVDDATSQSLVIGDINLDFSTDSVALSLSDIQFQGSADASFEIGSLSMVIDGIDLSNVDLGMNVDSSSFSFSLAVGASMDDGGDNGNGNDNGNGRGNGSGNGAGDDTGDDVAENGDDGAGDDASGGDVTGDDASDDVAGGDVNGDDSNVGGEESIFAGDPNALLPGLGNTSLADAPLNDVGTNPLGNFGANDLAAFSGLSPVDNLPLDNVNFDNGGFGAAGVPGTTADLIDDTDPFDEFFTDLGRDNSLLATSR